MSIYSNFLKHSERRRKKMRLLYAQGKTQQQIANKFGVTRQRVQQLLAGRK